MPWPPQRGTTGVYCWVNLVTGKVYVGSSSRSLSCRMKEHISALDKGKHTNRHLQHSWRKHGRKRFLFVVLTVCSPLKCTSKETLWIERLQATDQMYGYNVCPEGKNCLGAKRSDETRSKLGKFKHSPEHIRRTVEANKSRVWTAKARKEAAKLMKLLWARPEIRKRMIAARLGKKASRETREKMSRSRIGKRWTAEQRTKSKVAFREALKRDPERLAAMIRRCREMSKLGHAVKRKKVLAAIQGRKVG